MISLKKRDQGFTIVELLIVIVVIGILALLVITTYSGIQAKARNAKRGSDIKSLQTQIEAFFSQNGYYPSLGDLNGTASGGWVSTNMKSLDVNAMVDPLENNGCLSGGTCLKSGTVPATNAKAYYYNVTDSSGNSCEGAGNDVNCAKYTLTADYEGSVNGQTQAVAQNLD